MPEMVVDLIHFSFLPLEYSTNKHMMILNKVTYGVTLCFEIMIRNIPSNKI
jgi:hypothetical protein